MSGTIILVIGTSSAGKSSMIRELQALLPDHYLALGIDTFFQMVSPRWGGGIGGPLSKEGFAYVTARLDMHPYTRIVYGAVGNSVLRGMHRALAAHPPRSGRLLPPRRLIAPGARTLQRASPAG